MLPPPGIAAVLVQVTSCPTAEHVQSVPTPETNERPGASVFLTVVVVPAAIAAPPFVTRDVVGLSPPSTQSPTWDLTRSSAFGTTLKLPLRLWVMAFSRPSEAVTVAVQLPKVGVAGIVYAYSRIRLGTPSPSVGLVRGVNATLLRTSGPPSASASDRRLFAADTSKPPNGSLTSARMYTVSPGSQVGLDAVEGYCAE